MVLRRRSKSRQFGLAISPRAVTLTEDARAVRQVPRGLEPGALDYFRMLDTIRRERADRLFPRGSQQTRLSPQPEIGGCASSSGAGTDEAGWSWCWYWMP
jgi:hypothetical protein